MRVAALTQAILADRHLRREPTTQTLACFCCGRNFTYRGPQGDDSGRFCNTVCRLAYDAGFQPEPTIDVFTVEAWNRPISKKKHGATLANDELIRPRRLCVRCGAKLPVWINGKKARKNQKYCKGCSG